MIDLQQVKLVAHRGASADYPENTMLAFEQARLAGVDGIELDLQLSGDGRVMIHHDETFLEALRLENHSSEELRQEDMGQGETMPFLSEVLAEYSEDLTLYLEVKLYKHQQNSAYRQALLKSLRKELRSLAEDAQFEILSFDLTFLELIGKECPGWRCVYNIEDGEFHEDFTERYSFIYAICQDLVETRAEYSQNLQSHQVKSYCYGVNSEEELKRALDCGVDLIMTDRPKWLCQLTMES